MPYNLVLNLNCNLNCEYCFEKGFENYPAKHITPEAVDYVLKFFLNSGRKEISFMGGEPTLYPQLESTLNAFLKQGFTVSLKSNGLWTSEISVYFRQIPTESLSFLINVNSPTTYSESQWKRIQENINYVSDKQVILSINFFGNCWEYQYVLDLAAQNNIRFIRWALANPIYNQGSPRTHGPCIRLSEYRAMSDHVLHFIEQASSLGISTLGDHSVPICMFSDKQRETLKALDAEINAKCEGTIDIMPDLQVVYCLPLYSLFQKKYLNEFRNLGEVELFFQSRVNPLRRSSYVLDECFSCRYEVTEECHGGCLSHRQFPEDMIEEATREWNMTSVIDRVPYIPDYIEIREERSGSLKHGSFTVIDNKNDNTFRIDPDVEALLRSIDGRKTFGEIMLRTNEIRQGSELSEAAINRLIESLRTFGILHIKK